MADSILQSERCCYFCESVIGLEEHHIFAGVANRRISEKYGLKVWLCHEHHPGNDGAQYDKEKNRTVIFSTYQSIDVVKEAIDLYKREVDLIICDEAHRTTGVVLKDKAESNFTKVHRNDFIQAKKRLYMTATPRLYSANIKVRAKEDERIDVLCSMDDEATYGEEFHRLTFRKSRIVGRLQGIGADG